MPPAGDAEFGEDAIQVPTNGAVREKKALADLTVRQPFGGELRDLQLLGGEALTGVRRAAADRLDRRSRLMSSTLRPRAEKNPAPMGDTWMGRHGKK